MIKSYAHKKVDVFYDRPYSTDLPYYVLSPSNIQYILKKNCGAFEQIVVDLQSGAQIRVLPLLDVLIIILSLPVTAAVSSESSVQLLT